ncbi:MAG: universal stress protein [Nitrospira sp.]|nr:universal stress protein [Nitrospira sp.]MBH0180693.1 universal stress protein [Nitrospira sp.]MBH0187260.1 universal stress protein [Nitrospira sp.]MBH0189058.1 universal stress protein [Nitrospira sp.]MBH0195789.1 universal stress protein [Nitrospira sp.]
MKVLAVTDGSKYGRWAVEWTAQIPLTVQPVVRALHVVDVAGVRTPFMIQPMIVGTRRYLQDEIKRMEANAKTVKKQTETVLKESGLNGTVIVDRGGVATSIMKHAKRGVNLLAIGSRGLDTLDRFMLGSVSNYAIHHAPCSVLVVKETPRPVRRILLAIDGSPASDKAVRFLLRYINPAPDGPDREPVMVTIAHVMPDLKYPGLREAGTMLVQRYVDRVAKAGFQVNESMRLGKTADQILTAAKQEKADLIVTGAKGLGAIGRVLLGSVSTRVVQHAACSVLVVR